MQTPVTLSARSATTVIAQIAGLQRAVAEVELTITKDHPGDNYIVRATCIDPQGRPFNDDSGVTADPDADAGIPAAHIRQTTVLTAWRRIYIESDRMFRVGSNLDQDAMAGQNTLVVEDVQIMDLAAGDWVHVLDRRNQLAPFGETAEVQVVDPPTNTITITGNLANTYLQAEKGHVGKIIDASDPNFKPYYRVDDPQLQQDIQELFAAAFLEVRFEDEGSGPVPHRDQFDPAELEPFSDDWFHMPASNRANYFQIIAASKLNIPTQAPGVSDPVKNYTFIFVERIEEMYPSEPATSTAITNITGHEVTHQHDFVPSAAKTFNGEHLAPEPGVVPVADGECCMYPGTPGSPAANKPLRWCIYHVYTVRDHQDEF